MGPLDDAAISSMLPEADELTAAPLSPYSATATLRRELSMPLVPNFDIAASPPGSPPLGPAKRIKQFLNLQKQGLHFNNSVTEQAGFYNPGAATPLFSHAELRQGDEYMTSLDKKWVDATGLPSWAHKDELRKAIERETARREKEKVGVPREFVPATGENGAVASGGTEANGEAAAKRRKLK